METEKKFKTKTGYCHILTDKIVLTRDGIIGNIAEKAVGNNLSRTLIIYCIISILLIYIGYQSILKSSYIETVFYFLIAGYLIYGVLSSLNNSATPVIDRSKIKTVKFKKAIKGLTRSRFEVFFFDDMNKLKKRLIMLPGSMTGGDEATEEAIRIMQEENLIAL